MRGVKQLGVRLGNWLTVEQGRSLMNAPAGPVDILHVLPGKNDFVQPNHCLQRVLGAVVSNVASCHAAEVVL